MKLNKNICIDSPTVISDFIENLLLNDFDFKNHSDLYNLVWYILESGGYADDKHLEYLDFDVQIKDEGSDVKIVGNNIVSALWFSNIFPNNPDDCYVNNRYEDKKHIYYFDFPEKKLLIRKKDNNE